MQTAELPAVLPLSKATAQQLSRLSVDDTDVLSIWLDTHPGTKKDCLAIKPGRRDPITGELQKYFFPSFRASAFCSRIPEVTKVHDRYLCAPTDLTVIMISSVWERKQLLFTDNGAKLIYDYILRRLLVQDLRAKIIAEFKVNKTEPNYPYPDHPDYPLSGYQKVGVIASLGQEGYALWNDRGTGKTATAIARICEEARRNNKNNPGVPLRVLIVCPKKARFNWQKEFSKFATCAGRATVIRGTEQNRLKLFCHGIRKIPGKLFNALIVSYDSIAQDVDRFKLGQWHIIIADESHYFKSSKTLRWKCMRELRDNSSMRMSLTGTPIGNSVLDIWTQLEFLGDGLSGFTSEKSFRKFFVTQKPKIKGQGVEKVNELTNIPLIHERLSRLCYIINKKEAGLNLPDKVYDTYEVSMTPKQQEIYINLANKLYFEIENSDLQDGAVNPSITVNHVLTKLLRLAQVTSGFVKWDARYDEIGNCISESKIEEIDPGKNPKILAIEDMLSETMEDDPNAKTIIWSAHVPDLHAICRKLVELKIKHVLFYGKTSEQARLDAEFAFNNDPETRVFVANPTAAGDSLNLLGYNPEKGGITYCNHEIYYYCNWSYLTRSQSEDRAHRRGTKMPLRITDLIIPDTIDVEIRNSVSSKEAHAMEIQDIKDMLQRIVQR